MCFAVVLKKKMQAAQSFFITKFYPIVELLLQVFLFNSLFFYSGFF